MTSLLAISDRFWSKVSKTDGCWLWNGWLDDQGRGRFHLEGTNHPAPRAAWILTRGKIEPSELEVCHTCDTPRCCRPDHLFLGTKQQNMQDMARKGRCGIQLHPERYKRERKPTTKYRPVKQSLTPAGIDHRTWTRLATAEERELAREALVEMENNFNRIALVPAPDPHFPSQKIRVIESRNIGWYSEFCVSHNFQVKRVRVVKALTRVAVKGRVRGNGCEVELLGHIKNWKKEPVYA